VRGTSKVMNTTPDAGQVFQACASSNMSEEEAIAEFVDNSFDAGATKISVKVVSESNKKKSPVESYLVWDNGSGMDPDGLEKCFTLYNKSPHKTGDTGKFGIGGTTSAWKLGTQRTILTKTVNGDLVVGEQDALAPDKRAMFVKPTPEQEKTFAERVGDHGTMIYIKARARGEGRQRLCGTVEKNLREQLSCTYHKLLDNVSVSVNGEPLKPRDPLFLNSPQNVVEQREKEISIEGFTQPIKLISVVLRDQSFSALQGIYVLRNNRLIVQGDSHSKLWTRRTTRNNGRVMIIATDEHDSLLGVSSNKNAARFDDLFVSEVDSFFKTARDLSEKYDKKGRTSTSGPNVEQDKERIKKKIDKAAEIGKVLDLPLKKGKGATCSRSPKKNKTGTNPKTGNGPKRASPQCGYRLPVINIDDFGPRSTKPFEIDYDESDNIRFTWNTQSDLYNKLYTNMNENSKSVVEAVIFAQTLGISGYDYDSTEWKIVLKFMEESLIKTEKTLIHVYEMAA